MKVVVPPQARKDVQEILARSLDLFGPRQAAAYAAHLKHVISLLAEHPLRLSSRDRSDIAVGLRSLHLMAVAGRKRAAHSVYYRLVKGEEGEDLVLVSRVLHERMDPLRHIE